MKKKSDLETYTYWNKNGVTREVAPFEDIDQLRRDGWIKVGRGSFEAYKKVLAKQDAAEAQAPAAADAGSGAAGDERTPAMQQFDKLLDILRGTVNSTHLSHLRTEFAAMEYDYQRELAAAQERERALRAALKDLLAMFKQSGDPDQTDIIEVWRDSPGQVSLTREMQAKVDAVRAALQAAQQPGQGE